MHNAALFFSNFKLIDPGLLLKLFDMLLVSNVFTQLFISNSTVKGLKQKRFDDVNVGRVG